MARQREFDEATALEAAMACFWRRGYEATSMHELTASIGISGPKLASTAPSAASARSSPPLWSATSISPPGARIKRLEAPRPPKDAEIIRRSLSDPERRGWLLINSALEIAPHDRELDAVISGCLAVIEAHFRHAAQTLVVEASQAAVDGDSADPAPCVGGRKHSCVGHLHRAS
jgi:TetR/AcrR family transcriptional repressor of nem operon